MHAKHLQNVAARQLGPRLADAIVATNVMALCSALVAPTRFINSFYHFTKA